MRLRNRQMKATWWTDPDILRWSRDKRLFYQSLWALAEDSCCIEDDMFAVKVAAWASPLDADMSLDRFESWRQELIADAADDGIGKLVPYEAGGKKCLYIPSMARHEKPRNPQSPDIPLPLWVKWRTSLTDARKGSYEHNYPELLDYVQRLYNAATSVPALPCPALSCPELPCVDGTDAPVDNSASVRAQIREELHSIKDSKAVSA